MVEFFCLTKLPEPCIFILVSFFDKEEKMTETIFPKPRIIYEWRLAPDNRHAKYYDVYVRYPFDIQSTLYAPFSVLIGVTDGIETDRIYPLNHPKFSELGTTHFGYDIDASTEGYLRHMSIFPIPEFAMSEILEFLKQHAPKPSFALDELRRGEEGGIYE